VKETTILFWLWKDEGKEQFWWTLVMFPRHVEEAEPVKQSLRGDRKRIGEKMLSY
jgi:hypothetical protein